MKLLSLFIFYTVDSVNVVTVNPTSDKTSEFISTGGIQPAYFLGAVLFIIFIMIALLMIKIMNLKHSEKIENNKLQQ
jgi:hypothetical protein